MKKQIITGAAIAMLILVHQNTHASNVECYDTDWKACSWGNTNVEICDKEGWQDYRCRAGYYYDVQYPPASCTSSCHPCPSDGTSNPNNNTGITSCYQTPGTHTDKTGTYKLTANCYYKE